MRSSETGKIGGQAEAGDAGARECIRVRGDDPLEQALRADFASLTGLC